MAVLGVVELRDPVFGTLHRCTLDLQRGWLCDNRLVANLARDEAKDISIGLHLPQPGQEALEAVAKRLKGRVISVVTIPARQGEVN